MKDDRRHNRRILQGLVVVLVLLKHVSESFTTAIWSSSRTIECRVLLEDVDLDDGQDEGLSAERPPIPAMPSDMFQRMASSQLELLANSLTTPDNPLESKVESMALYLPQENVHTGQLEFTPVVLYPDPNSERVFIASDAASGQAPTLPPTLNKLPGFAHATALLPGYPMMSSDQVNPGVGIVEEVQCDIRFKDRAAALSVPLLSGSQTVGVLLVSPSIGSNPDTDVAWTEQNREQVTRAAQSLSMALSMDNERNYLKEQNAAFREGLSDSLHQVKNPLQALRTYGKILQRQIAANDEESGDPTYTPHHLLELTERLMIQSERVVDLMVPMDILVENLEHSTRMALQPAKPSEASLVKRSEPPQLLPWEHETLEFARENGTASEFPTSAAYPAFKRDSAQQSDGSRANRQSKAHPVSTPKASASPSQSTSSSKASSSTTVVGDLELEMTFVSDVLEPILSAFAAIASEREIRFQVVQDTEELPGVWAAPKYLQEAVSNLLDNALKYVVLPKAGSPFLKNPSPLVRVRMVSNQSDEPGVTIVVEDNGPGIQAADRNTIFQRGYRSASTSFVEGTGIGLDISNALIRRMGGTLAVAGEGEYQDTLNGAVMKSTLYRRPKTNQ